MSEYMVNARKCSVCTRKECMFFFFFILRISIKYNCSSLSFRISVTLLILCQDDLSMDESRVLKAPTTIVFLSVPLCLLVFVLCFGGLQY